MVTNIDSCFGVENAHFEFLPHTYLKVKNFLVFSKLKHSKPNLSSLLSNSWNPVLLSPYKAKLKSVFLPFS